MQDELLAVARFWLERGVDGFRLDTINFYFCDAELRDNPVLPPELRDYSTAPAVNPYNWQEHLYDKSRPEMIGFLRRFRALLEEFGDIAAVGEVGDAQRGMEIMGEYTRGDDLMQMCYAFEFLSPEAPSGRRVGAGAASGSPPSPRTAGPAGPSRTTTSSGTPRAGRWTATQLRVYLALLLTLRGSVCLYQGEELGLTEAYVPFEELQDPYGKRFWPKFRGRDGCRTPMVWLGDNLNGGFSEAKPWLPVAMEHLRMAVGQQEDDPGLDARLLPADARVAEGAAGARQGRLRDRRDLGQLHLLRPRRRRRGGLLRLQPRRRAGRRRAAGRANGGRSTDSGFAGAHRRAQRRAAATPGAVRGAARNQRLNF